MFKYINKYQKIIQVLKKKNLCNFSDNTNLYMQYIKENDVKTSAFLKYINTRIPTDNFTKQFSHLLQALETAKNLLAFGDSVDKNVKIIGLSLQEIEKLKNISILESK